MRTDAIPSWVNSNHQCEMLKNIPFNEKIINESFLQKLLRKHPEVLPVKEFDADFAPLIPLAREVKGVDNLFISPSGKLTLVETKLWKNPESTREAFAQIIDYASNMVSWEYDDLEKNVKESMDPAITGQEKIYDLIKSSNSEEKISEEEFINKTTLTLSRCRFFLLIVGDGIKEGLERMLDMLQDHGIHQFTLGLVEMQLWRRENDLNTLVIPRVVLRTQEIIRTVVKIEPAPNTKISITLNKEQDRETSKYSRRTLSMDEFFEMVTDEKVKLFYDKLIKYAEGLSMVPVKGSASVALKIRDPKESGQDFSVLVLNKEGTICSGHPSWLPRQLDDCGYSQKLADEFYASLYELVPKSDFTGKHSNYVDAKLLEPHYDRLTEIIKKLVDGINKEAERE